MAEPGQPDEGVDATQRIKDLLLGKPREIRDPRIFHHIALVAFLAWVGLGADGLSSSAYGPEEGYRALFEEGATYLAVALAFATAITVFVISWSYSRIIEAFPSGGGGYVVPFKLLGPTAGALSGSALLIDYVLTIAISIASGVDAVFSYFPEALAFKVPFAMVIVGILLVLNLRGVKESVTVLAPIFLLFLLTHAVVIVAGIAQHAGDVGAVAARTADGYRTGYATLGFGGLLLIFMRAYSMGGGTYTGIEAVANGMGIMREPKVQTAKRTMVYMSISLAITAAGILICYLLTSAEPTEGRTMNAVLVDSVVGGWTLGGVPFGRGLAPITLFSEAALLFVAAQAGFIAGPRVMASMAVDSWLPHRYAALSDRLTSHNGIQLMAIAGGVVLWATGGDVSHLVILYSINVFLTFSLSNVAMCVRAVRSRRILENWRREMSIHVVASILCIGILAITVYEKFGSGGWVTLLITGVLLGICLATRRHYSQVKFRLRRLEVALADLPASEKAAPEIDPLAPTAILFVGAFGGLGVHSLLSIFRFFPSYFKNVVFVSIGVIDSGNFKGSEEIDALHQSTQRVVDRYAELAKRLGVAGEGYSSVGTDAVDEAEKISEELALKYPRHMFFGGKLVFKRERWYERLLHNETAFAIQRRLQWKGHPMTVLPVRVLE